jgi:hypothetical protein
MAVSAQKAAVECLCNYCLLHCASHAYVLRAVAQALQHQRHALFLVVAHPVTPSAACMKATSQRSYVLMCYQSTKVTFTLLKVHAGRAQLSAFLVPSLDTKNASRHQEKCCTRT